MTHLIRLDLERIQRNLEHAAGTPQTEEDVLRLLARRRVWRHDGHWWGTDEAAVREFADGEILETRTAQR